MLLHCLFRYAVIAGKVVLIALICSYISALPCVAMSFLLSIYFCNSERDPFSHELFRLYFIEFSFALVISSPSVYD